MKYVLISLFLILPGISLGQNEGPEYWRNLAFQSKLKGDPEQAIIKYLKVLEYDGKDYDALLALGRLYRQVGKTDSALYYFREIYKNDSADVEALNGFGDCYTILGDYDRAISCLEKAHRLLPDNVPTCLSLAKVYGYSGRMDDAIMMYRNVIRIDSSYAESWAGIGRMYYWKGMPKSAARYYSRALDLDPGNPEIKKEFDHVVAELKTGLTLKIKPLKEEEENYEINALINSIKYEKRMSDHFQLDANVLVDYSNRDNYFDNSADTSRWYHNAWLKGNFFIGQHKLSLWTGYSLSDEKSTAYGLSWLYNGRLGKLVIKNALAAGYEYFYYWNRVGSRSVSEEAQISYGFLRFSARYLLGSVDAVLVKDIINETTFVDENDFKGYGVSLQFRVLARPELSLGLNHSFLDYHYKSPLYYSPFGRRLSGASVSVYYPAGKFFLYGNYAYNFGNEYNYEQVSGEYEKVSMNVDNWTTDVEIGYNYANFSVSAGMSRFYNPYYKSLLGFTSVKVLL